MARVVGAVTNRPGDFYAPFSLNRDVVLSSARQNGSGAIAPQALAESLASVWGNGNMNARSKPSRYNQPYEWMDLMERYEGMPLDVSTDQFTAAMLNERGNILLDYVAPIIPTDENVVRMTETEHFQLPYDITAAGGIARNTSHRRDVRDFSLQQFKRYQRIELAYLQDKNFGAAAMNDIVAVLSQQAQLTLALQVSMAIVVMPFVALNEKFARMTVQYDCARQYAMESMGFACAHVDMSRVNKLIESNITTLNGIDTVIIPEGSALMFAQMPGTSERLPCVEFGYDQETGRFYRALYKGEYSVKSLPLGVNGTSVHFIINPGYRYSVLDNDAEVTQTQKVFPTVAEVIIQPITHVDSPLDRDEDLSELNLAVASYDQTDTTIRQGLIRHSQGLPWCMIWNNRGDRKTGPSLAPPGEFGDAYLDLMKEYNKNKEIATYLLNGDETHNNNVPSGKALSAASLEAMEDFRHWFPFFGVKGGKLVAPVLIGDLSRRALSNRWLERVARAIVLAGRLKHGLSASDLERNANNIKLLVDTYLPDLPQETLLDLIGQYTKETPAADARGKFDAYRPEDDDDEDVVPAPGSTKAKDAAVAATAAATKARAEAAASEGVEEVEGEGSEGEDAATLVTGAGVDSNMLIQALKSGKLDLTSRLVKAFAHVPDESVAHFATFFKAANAEGESGSGTVGRVLTALEKHSLKTGAKAALENVHKHLSSGKTLASLVGKPLANNRDFSKSEDVDHSLTKFATEVRTLLESRGGEDAMDIDDHGMDYEYGPFDAPKVRGHEANAHKLYQRHTAVTATPTDTFQRRYDAFNRETSLDSIHQLFVRLIMFTPNTLRTHVTLASKLGIALLRLNYWRMFQRYRMLCMSMVRAGERTMAVLFGHQIVTPNLNGAEQYVNIVVQFRAGVLPRAPNSTKLITYPLCDKLISDINLQFVRTTDDYLSPSTHKPSIVALPVPIDETEYNFPIHVNNKDIYHPTDPNSVNPRNKHSAAALNASFIGEDFLRRQSAIAKSSDIYDSVMMSLIAHRSWAIYWDKMEKRWVSVATESPRGEDYHNVNEAAKVWSGTATQFPKNPKWSVVA